MIFFKKKSNLKIEKEEIQDDKSNSLKSKNETITIDLEELDLTNLKKEKK